MNDFIIINKNFLQIPLQMQRIELTGDYVLLCSENTGVKYSANDIKTIIIGDFIDTNKDFSLLSNSDLQKARGHFYVIKVRDNTIKVFNNFFSMLPIFYCSHNNLIASSIDLIKSNVNKQLSFDKKFILESLLFNYGFFNNTLYKEIKLTPCHHSIILKDQEIKFSKLLSIQDLFVSSPIRGKNTKDKLSDLFIDTVKNYFPDEKFNIAFTSGFDGRTLLSCALHHQKNFNTFSFGRLENDDVSIPLKNATSLQVPYQYFDLGNDTYIQYEYYQNAIEYNSSGYFGNGFLYPHFLYSTKEISKQSPFLISGACGSELFRALHNTGAVTSKALVDVFRLNSDEQISEALRNSPVFDVLNKKEFSDELEELIEEIIEYKNNLPSDISANQQFYIFVFEEIFRKFFGQWIVVQQQYSKVRTPFLDYTFVKELLQSKYAGVNNDFYTDNPIKRMKGQSLYAHIIKKTNSQIYGQKTGKGYRPIDIINPKYIYKIVVPFLKKRLKRNVTQTNLDNLGIISGVQSKTDELYDLIKNSEGLFNKEILIASYDRLTPYTKEKERDLLLMSLSLLQNMRTDDTHLKSQFYEYDTSINRLQV